MKNTPDVQVALSPAPIACAPHLPELNGKTDRRAHVFVRELPCAVREKEVGLQAYESTALALVEPIWLWDLLIPAMVVATAYSRFQVQELTA